MTTTNNNPQPQCEGGLWECPTEGLNWCTRCNTECEECGTKQPEDS